MSVSMVDTKGNNFENPAYEAGEKPLTTNEMATATSAPVGTNKVNKHKLLILQPPLPPQWLHLFDMLYG